MKAPGICDLYFPQNGRSIVVAPRDDDHPWEVEYAFTARGSNDPPMFIISVANCFLQYLFNLRDSALSCDDDEMGGITKIGCVTVLSLTACIGYTALNILEIPVRAVATLVLSVSIPLFFLDRSINGGQDTCLRPVSKLGLIFCISALLGTIQGTAQIGAGLFAAYKMAVFPSFMRDVDQFTETVTCGIPKSINQCIFSLFPKID